MKKTLYTLILLLSIGTLLAGCGGGSGKNIAVGPAASETQAVTAHILDAYGIEDYKEYQEGFGDAMEGIQDGNIDVAFSILGLPSGSVDNLQAASGDVKILSLSDEIVKKLEENSMYRKYTISKDAYDFLEEDVQTVTAYAVLVGNTNTIDEELGYQLAKIMHEKAEENTHAQSAHMKIENALNGKENIPIHPGAKRYYEEQGLKVEGPVAEVTAKEDDRKNEFILGTGSQGGTYYPLGGEMANIWKKYIKGVNVTGTETGASVENLASIRDDAMDLGMTVHAPAVNAIEGKADFEGGAVENVAFIGHIYPEVVQIITREATGINSLEDLK